MKADKEYDVHLGENIKYLMRAFQITQVQLADKLAMPDSHICNLLQKPDIDDEMLQKIAAALGNGITPELIKAYNHDDTINFIVNNYTQNVENGGNGTLIPEQNYNQTIENGGTGSLIPEQNNDNSNTFEEGSTQNNYVAVQAFEAMKEIADLKSEIMRLRMKYEPDAVEAERKNKG